jgi:hypothetical protein
MMLGARLELESKVFVPQRNGKKTRFNTSSNVAAAIRPSLL